MRLGVASEGDLWRWDGFVGPRRRAQARRHPPGADAPGWPRSKAEIETLEPRAKAAREVLTAATPAPAVRRGALREARRAPPGRRAEGWPHARAGAGKALSARPPASEAQAKSLDDVIARFAAELADARGDRSASRNRRRPRVTAVAESDLAVQAGRRPRRRRSRARGGLEPPAALMDDRGARTRGPRAAGWRALVRDRDDWTRRVARRGQAPGPALSEAYAAKAEAALRKVVDALIEAPGDPPASFREAAGRDRAAAEARRAKSSDALAQAEGTARLEADRELFAPPNRRPQPGSRGARQPVGPG
jgi:chromosome segregation protein